MLIQQMEAIERIHVSLILLFRYVNFKTYSVAKIAQLGERMTEDHKVRCSIHLLGEFFFFFGFQSILLEHQCFESQSTLVISG